MQVLKLKQIEKPREIYELNSIAVKLKQVFPITVSKYTYTFITHPFEKVK